MPTVPDNFYGAVAPEYQFTYNDLGGDEKNEAYFWFPYDPSISKKICYKLEIYRGNCELHEFYGSHVEMHYVILSFKELMLTLNFDLRPRRKLLDDSIEHAPNAHREKFAFLKQIWKG
jgi:hypothetical protein